jgi:hypothetical protein
MMTSAGSYGERGSLDTMKFASAVLTTHQEIPEKPHGISGAWASPDLGK